MYAESSVEACIADPTERGPLGGSGGIPLWKYANNHRGGQYSKTPVCLHGNRMRM